MITMKWNVKVSKSKNFIVGQGRRQKLYIIFMQTHTIHESPQIGGSLVCADIKKIDLRGPNSIKLISISIYYNEPVFTMKY